MGTTKKYWKGIEELKNSPSFQASAEREFPQDVSVDEFLNEDAAQEASTGRRDFLKFLGFSVAAATLAACETPVTKVIPYVNKPENVTPGMPTWYASTYYDGNSYASILVKTREGRPILIKGNKDYGITSGSVNPQIIASVLSLYDSERLQGPSINNEAVNDWGKLDVKVKNELAQAKNAVTLVSSSVISPSTNAVIEDFKNKYGADHIQYDAVSYSGIRKAAIATWGKNIIPNVNFAEAKTIVSISADFLNSWLLPTKFTCGYLKRRNPDAGWMSKHFQFETNMSIAGSNADVRGMIKPSEQVKVAAAILAGIGGGAVPGVDADLSSNEILAAKVAKAIDSLKESKGQSVIVAGSNDMGVQLIVNAINIKLGALNHTVNVNDGIRLFQSEDDKMNTLVDNVIAGKGPKAIIFMDTNPVYSHAKGTAFGEALANVNTSISFSLYADETGSKCKIACPTNHGLESWNDFQPTESHYSIAQPTIRPLYNTRASQDSLMVWSDDTKVHPGKDSRLFYGLVRQRWESNQFKRQSNYGDFESFWSASVHNSAGEDDAIAPTQQGAVNLSAVKNGLSIAEGEVEIALYQKAGIGSGILASNPWLQEMPDPMTKVTWDNYITMAPSDMNKGGYSSDIDQENGANQAIVKVDGVELTLPVIAQPGQKPGTIGIALGYGRGENGEAIGKAAYHTGTYGGHKEGLNGGKTSIGANAYKLTQSGFEGISGSVTKAGDEKYPIAMTQIHSTVMARHSIIKETTLNIYKHEDKNIYNPPHVLHTHDGEKPVSDFDLWKAHPVEGVGHRWGMTIDLNTCIGCGSCLIACQAENNVPVVGKDEVRRGREMHWLRLDRYYSSDEEAAIGQRNDKDTFDYAKAEEASENPSVVFMPMMCQHCNHAPCETVCPVAATTHSNEGLNMMTYNRCIGTRYCANNCPYKVRRFNWFNYPSYKKFTEVNPAQDDLGRMVLNPDVVVRTRGVMEKCSMCVQNIQAAKLKAKMAGRPIVDDDISAVCGDACPTSAITMGDWNDTESAVRKSSEDDRSYQVLEEIGVKPNIWYKVKVRNNENTDLDRIAAEDQERAAHHHGGGEHAESEAHGAELDSGHDVETKGDH
jgi:molybdopterin-containing oxidoreductase family iron-sulfur binding subunit